MVYGRCKRDCAWVSDNITGKTIPLSAGAHRKVVKKAVGSSFGARWLKKVGGELEETGGNVRSCQVEIMVVELVEKS